jgi:sucrose-6-phosphate hydrolase SacC (GH32 family)
MTLARALLLLCVVGVAKADQTKCFSAAGKQGPCGPDRQLCGPNFGATAPQYHIHSGTCSMNDPNGPVYDPVYGFYHMFYQDHLAIPNDGAGRGPVYGHAVSRDLTMWARLPVAIWNDRPYDSAAIFTGSATVVNGKVMQIYPGICNKKQWDNCVTGTNFNLAVPADPDNDPLYHNWTKYWGNPIVNNTQRDPSTAWQTPYGEWRLTSYDTTTYGSKDFKSWYVVGKNSDFPQGECPSFFPFPRVVDKVKDPPNVRFPTHVHKASIEGKDWMQVGTWSDGKPGETGSFAPTPSFDFNRQIIDSGNFYASKDLYDPLQQRRINYGWARVSPGSTLSLPREILWSQKMKQLLYVPLREQEALRKDIIVSFKDKQVEGFFATGNNKQLKQAESNVIFEIPKTPGTLGIVAFAGSSPTSTDGIFFYVNITRATLACMLGPEDALCNATVGAVGKSLNFTDVLKLSAGDKTLSFRIFTDQTFAECYWQGGRVAMTANNPQQLDKATVGENLAIRAEFKEGVLVQEMNVWSVSSIWVSPKHVLNTPRPK